MTALSHQDRETVFRPHSLKAVFSGEHAWCGEKMMLSSDLPDAVPLGDFLAGDGLAETLDRYAQAHGGADRRAVASFWSLYYFSALTIPYVVARRAETTLPIDLDTMTIAIGEDGLPRAFGLAHEGDWSEEQDLVEVITPLVDAHLSRAVALLKEKSGIAPKLAWNNAAVYIDYAFNTTDRAPSKVTITGRPTRSSIARSSPMASATPSTAACATNWTTAPCTAAEKSVACATSCLAFPAAANCAPCRN